MILKPIKKVKKWLLSSITRQNFRWGKVAKYCPGEELFSTTKIFPDEVFVNKVVLLHQIIL